MCPHEQIDFWFFIGRDLVNYHAKHKSKLREVILFWVFSLFFLTYTYTIIRMFKIQNRHKTFSTLFHMWYHKSSNLIDKNRQRKRSKLSLDFHIKRKFVQLEVKTLQTISNLNVLYIHTFDIVWQIIQTIYTIIPHINILW